MFRRFMIVCWVLFAIPVVVSLVSWPVYYKYGNDLDGLIEEPKPRADFSDLLNDNNSSVPPDFTFRQIDPVGRALERKQESWGIAAFASMGIAAVILLWNILCHTAAWVIAGRKTQREVIDG